MRLQIRARISDTKLPFCCSVLTIWYNSRFPQMGSKWFEYSPGRVLHTVWELVFLIISQKFPYFYSPTLACFSHICCHHCQKQQISHCCWCPPMPKALHTMPTCSIAKTLRTWLYIQTGQDSSTTSDFTSCVRKLLNLSKSQFIYQYNGYNSAYAVELWSGIKELSE